MGPVMHHQPSLPLPAGWVPGFLPGADLLLLPPADPDRSTPNFTVRRWDSGIDLPSGTPTHDPRLDGAPESARFGSHGGPDAQRGVPVSMDRWASGSWFGWRFLRLVPTVSGGALAEVRWLLWPMTEKAPADFDMMRDDPKLDVTASCDVSDLVLMHTTFDALATDIPRGWRPRLVPDHPSAGATATVHRRPLSGDVDTTGDGIQSRLCDDADSDLRRPTLSGIWAGTSLLPLSRGAVEVLLNHGSKTPPNTEPEGVVLELQRAGLFDRESRTLRAPATAWAKTRNSATMHSRLTAQAANGRRRTLDMRSSQGLAAVIYDESTGDGSTTHAVGLYPQERLAELLVRAADLGPSDSRRLTHDVVPLELLLRRTIDPKTTLPKPFVSDPRWQELWSEEWLLWRLETTWMASEQSSVVMGVNAGRWGNHMATRILEDKTASATDNSDTVRLVPVQTSSLYVRLLDLLT